MFNKINLAKVTVKCRYIFMNKFALEYNYKCKYHSTKPTLQNLHENCRYIFMNEFGFKCNYNCKYCSTKSSLQNLHENVVTFLWMNLLFNMNIIVKNHPCKVYMHIYLSHIKSSDKKLPLNRKLLPVSVSKQRQHGSS